MKVKSTVFKAQRTDLPCNIFLGVLPTSYRYKKYTTTIPLQSSTTYRYLHGHTPQVDGNCFLSPQGAITCSKLTIETLKQGVKYIQS